jgi:hypothetical protein
MELSSGCARPRQNPPHPALDSWGCSMPQHPAPPPAAAGAGGNDLLGNRRQEADQVRGRRFGAADGDSPCKISRHRDLSTLLGTKACYLLCQQDWWRPKAR